MSRAPELWRRFLNEEQDPEIVKSFHDRVSQILTSGEEILYIAVQRRPMVNYLPETVALTNKRFIVFRPRLLGGSEFEDYIWRDLDDVKLTESITGGTITLTTVSGQPPIVVAYLPKAQARRVYSLAQEMEEKAREERRARELEERRASAAGGFLMHHASTPPTAAAAASPAPAPDDPVATLQKLKQMLDAGLIDQSEYDAKKSEILSKM